jgi:hypothetical protein
LEPKTKNLLFLFARAAVLLIWSSALSGCGDKPHISEIESGVDTRIDAIIALPSRDMGYFAATGGDVIDHEGGRWQLSEHALNSFATLKNNRYWVVGNRGYIAFTDVSDEVSIEWITTASGTEADLYGVEPVGDRVVVVGEDIVLLGLEGQPGVYTWTEPTPPGGGWGSLRDVSRVATSDSDAQIYLAVGLAGHALVSTGGDSWSVVPAATDADFHYVCNDLAIGDRLTRANWTGETWIVSGGASSADYVGLGGTSCGGFLTDYALSSDRWLTDVSHGEPRQYTNFLGRGTRSIRWASTSRGTTAILQCGFVRSRVSSN